ncbi:hypothetical protein RCIA32 [Methanocella arvoryzae MRE50]|uniref:Uncharacterized protein n=1 Tax=Methanocella arvoryzae (strain DSM 22066 / NBRC 105507 / MRE50) TaxID=351160 RepID=Q0W695_METAR|nr:hypothetical protein orf6 [uncultured archaeon]CAJ36098.1 hypothetical protein RCIA32 [Methanocella arvoryzae MRE50]
MNTIAALPIRARECCRTLRCTLHDCTGSPETAKRTLCCALLDCTGSPETAKRTLRCANPHRFHGLRLIPQISLLNPQITTRYHRRNTQCY